MLEHHKRAGAVLIAAALLMTGVPARAAEPGLWIDHSAEESRLVLYYFWSATCPHCKAARPFVDTLADSHSWIDVRDLEVTRSVDNRALYLSIADTLGQPARSVPAFVFCGEMVTGFDSVDGVGAYLQRRLGECLLRLQAGGDVTGSSTEAPVLPVIGSLEGWSLPALTVALAALDSFNPCAMFVLLFLLTLLVHARSRARMLLVGFTFVAVSGIAYFLFMAAWLNLFLLMGQLAWITLAAGALAFVIGAINVRDYWQPAQDATLSIPTAAKPRLFQRMRGLIAARSLAPLIGGTLLLAVVANAYELLCTAGFPMVFTRVLTLNELPTSAYYLYLLAYNAIYVLPLLVIVVLFTLSLGRRKLTDAQGRSLKLLSGLMMLGLGSVLLLAPDLLSNVAVAVALLMAAISLTAVVHRLHPPN